MRPLVRTCPVALSTAGSEFFFVEAADRDDVDRSTANGAGGGEKGEGSEEQGKNGQQARADHGY
jgi:hypothetical protein